MNRWIRLFVVALASTVLLAPDCGKKKSSSSSSSSSTTTTQQQEASDDTQNAASASGAVADTTADVSRSVASGSGKPRAIGNLTCPQFTRTGTLSSGTITLNAGSGCTSVLTGLSFSGSATFTYTFDDPTDTVTLQMTFSNYSVTSGSTTYVYNGAASSTATVATDGTCTMTITFSNLAATSGGITCTLNGQYTAVSNVDSQGNLASIVLNGCVTFSCTTDSVVDTICFQNTTFANPSCYCPTAGAATWTAGDATGSVTLSATFNGCGSATVCLDSACATVTQNPSECFLFPVPGS